MKNYNVIGNWRKTHKNEIEKQIIPTEKFM